MKTKLRTSRTKKRRNKHVFKSKSIEIFKQSFIQDKKTRVTIATRKEVYMQFKSNIIVSENFNLVYFEDDYFEDIEKYLTNHRSEE